MRWRLRCTGSRTILSQRARRRSRGVRTFRRSGAVTKSSAISEMFYSTPMPDLRNAIARGTYARHQICSPDVLTAWSHTRRFSTALSLARDFGGKRILDYGCGDGTFLALAMMADAPPAAAVGAELLDNVVEDCRVRYGAEPRMSFVQVASLDAAEHTRRYDAVFCMEVLEHVFDWEPALARMSGLL